jgi:hypothetical protein
MKNLSHLGKVLSLDMFEEYRFNKENYYVSLVMSNLSMTVFNYELDDCDSYLSEKNKFDRVNSTLNVIRVSERNHNLFGFESGLLIADSIWDDFSFPEAVKSVEDNKKNIICRPFKRPFKLLKKEI